MSNAWIDQIKPGDVITLAEIADGAQDDRGRSLADVLDEDHDNDIPGHATVTTAIPCDDGYTDLTLNVGLINEEDQLYRAAVTVSAPSAERVTILGLKAAR